MVRQTWDSWSSRRKTALLKPPPPPPVPITYAIYSTPPEVKRFAGHKCSMWVATTTVYKDFMQWNQVSYGRKPIEVDAATSACKGGNLTTYHPVLGMDRVAFALREAAKETDLVEMRPNNADAVTKMALSELTRVEIEYASHTQYIRDFAMNTSNHLAWEIRNLQ
ncbi:hypothetical protein OUZ56_011497 [Daphnia magna]|uniref:Uncharacterized protein n=1 Tax=Daphnia magna TaxID=35525 RepID=A0ABQ9Z0B3_9CRUS|nr:hypothetical protein OUZ56_011497 [Daphnia magna]